MTTLDREFELGLIPLNILLDQTQHAAWRRGFSQKNHHDNNKLDLFDKFETEVYQRIQQYLVPTIAAHRLHLPDCHWTK